jgi:hypothetical protein
VGALDPIVWRESARGSNPRSEQAGRSGAEDQSDVDEPPDVAVETEDIVPPKEIIIRAANSIKPHDGHAVAVEGK